MSEIENIYKLAMVVPKEITVCGIDEAIIHYPPFTAKKQLSLIKWLMQNKRLCLRKADYSNNFYMDTATTRLNGVDNSSFEECLAGILNLLWQDLTEQERTEIRSILRG